MFWATKFSDHFTLRPDESSTIMCGIQRPRETHFSQGLNDICKAEQMNIGQLGNNLRDSPCEIPIFQGFTFLAVGSAHDTIASNFSISFRSRVV